MREESAQHLYTLMEAPVAQFAVYLWCISLLRIAALLHPAVVVVVVVHMQPAWGTFYEYEQMNGHNTKSMPEIPQTHQGTN